MAGELRGDRSSGNATSFLGSALEGRKDISGVGERGEKKNDDEGERDRSIMIDHGI